MLLNGYSVIKTSILHVLAVMSPPLHATHTPTCPLKQFWAAVWSVLLKSFGLMLASMLENMTAGFNVSLVN